MVAQGYIATKYNEILRHRNLLHLLIMVFMVCILLIIQASTIISMEFHYGTIKIYSIVNIQEQL